MSTNSYLEDAASLMVELGVITKDNADNINHCVDDACFLLSDITSFIQSNPKVLEAMREAGNEKKLSHENIMKDQEFMIDQYFGYPDLLSFGKDNSTEYSTQKVSNGYELIFVESSELGLEKTQIGVLSNDSYFANELLINELNKRFS